MPHNLSALPGPFLELSTANLHLNDLSVDQLAALWNVFTKVGDSLHKGRRLENFVWRAWHREAHLLPPDSSWSDFADCTPLETPAISRAGSISHGLQRRPIVAQITPGYWAAKQADENAPSDPESGADWSDDSEEEGELRTKGAGKASRSNAAAGPSSGKQAEAPSRPRQPSADRGRPSDRDSNPQYNNAAGATADSSALQSPPSLAAASIARRRIGDTLSLGASEAVNDRKRAASSSSSAFGSRARVRYSNLRKANRSRPLSFQAALESLATGTESDDLTRLAQEHQRRGLGVAHERRSFQGPEAIDMLKSNSPQTQAAEDELIAASHSSAPAGSGFEARHAGIPDDARPSSIRTDSVGTLETVKGEPAGENSRAEPTMPLPTEPVQHSSVSTNRTERSPSKIAESQPQPVPASTKERESNKESPRAARGQDSKKAKFFLSASVSKSYDDDAHDYHDDNAGRSQPALENRTVSDAAGTGLSTSQQEDGKSEAAPLKPNKSRTDVRSGGLSSAHRNRSGASLHKGKGKVSGGRGSTGRLAAAGLTMTKAAAATGAAPPVTLAPSAATKGPAKPALVTKQQHAKKNKPVKFIMGADEEEDEDEEDGFSDEESEPEAKTAPALNAKKADVAPTSTATPAESTTSREDQAAVQADKRQSIPEPAKEVVQDDEWQNDDEDEWSSDTSAEAEEERRRADEAARRRRRAEEEHQKSLFQKIPVRSASTADLPNVVPARPKTPLQASQPQVQPAPARGLLSSLFHPEQEPHPPPGQLHGRPHASAADLRGSSGATIVRPSSTTGQKSERRQHRPPSLIGSLPRASDAGGPLRSKSAVALPVLNTTTTTTTMLDAGSGALDSDAEDEYLTTASRPRGKSTSSRRSDSRRSSRGDATVAESTASTERMLQQQQVSRQRRSASNDRSPQRAASAGDASPPAPPEPVSATGVSSHRRESMPLPTPAAPQTPRTTRRNMLRDELSESLRQNLLWERQSRNRMLGIGGNPSTAASRVTNSAAQASRAGDAPPVAPVARAPRRETVLGGGPLRPLTQGHTHNASDQYAAATARLGEPQGGTSQRTSSIHQHSRSTPHLPHAASNAHHQHNTPGGHGSGNGNGHDGLLHPPAFNRSQSGPASRPNSAQTSDEEGSSSSDLRRNMDESGHGGADRGRGGGRKKVMWPGGFPNYHQHGW
ncbi:hypothetical protein BCV69DRAFT_31510 [Microstroma glucosiphilum]|uniref:Uncharacterized protein n=1 Tax=Pseudomicrostroma glucosiphilum TaxID=1684307 RepID=A0A316U4L0_9BASI|nr:hypothetical protein BCV69DRAFT_31510 [Pseudomicrostroma glucosiphilum]PWN19744.1 hypothetical protein BCV69DRAFT_31510 [Pseudomicrostroma glucosiphilum]